MKIQGLIILSFLGVQSLAQVNLKKATPFANSITPENLKANLNIVAGAEMEGRETGTAGQKNAAAYIENEMKETGLLPAKDGQYQMSYPVYRDSVTAATLIIDNTPLSWKTQFNVSPANHNATEYFNEVVYINLNDSDWKQNKIDVTGKLVLFKPLETKSPNKSGILTLNIHAIMKRGAAAVLIIDSLIPEALTGSMSLTNFPAAQSINYAIIPQEVAAIILQKGIDSTALPLQIYKSNIQMHVEKMRQTLESSNVVGYIPGNTKKDEYVIISAHYDHIGKKDSLIWYGADDDGSGTVTVLNLAKAFAKAKAAGKGPERTIVFITFSGEEKGLWGSETYTNNPPFPFNKTTAALNIDMVGRIDSTHIKNDTLNYVYLVGDDKISSDLPAIANAANAFTKLEMNAKYNDPKDPEKIYTRSDHFNFAKKGVPVIFYYDGGNADYHRVTDTVDKIDFDLMSKRAKLIFYTAWELANRESMIVRDKPIPDAKRRRR